jgi:exodeoxyribonuclease VII large subunit
MQVYTVGQLTRKIRNLLELEVGLVWVEGEVSGMREQRSGHRYFTLKDEGAELACVVFRGRARGVKARLENGDKVRVFGELSVYEARGSYQLVVQQAEELGEGELQARFLRLKRKLEDEGLFDRARKRALPGFPECVALVTSPTGAAVQDMIKVLGRRAPWLQVLVVPVRVQGAGAAEEIAAALLGVGEWSGRGGLPAVDLVIVGRGGGSVEDLWAFNEEVVARAIAACAVPVVSAVGHETDTTIADLVADHRAPTPSAAAEESTPDGAALLERLDKLARRQARALGGRIELMRERLRRLGDEALWRGPRRRFEQLAQRLDDLGEGLDGGVGGCLERLGAILERWRGQVARYHPEQVLLRQEQRLAHGGERLERALAAALRSRGEVVGRAGERLRLLGPGAVLARGYSLTLTCDGRLVRDAGQLRPGDELVTRLERGEVRSEVRAVGLAPDQERGEGKRSDG